MPVAPRTRGRGAGALDTTEHALWPNAVAGNDRGRPNPCNKRCNKTGKFSLIQPHLKTEKPYKTTGSYPFEASHNPRVENPNAGFTPASLETRTSDRRLIVGGESERSIHRETELLR